MKSFADVIDAFGYSALAEILDTKESHVRTMKSRNSIPPRYFGTLAKEAPKRGITSLDLERLHRLQDKRFPKLVKA